LQHRLEFYNNEEISRIIKRSAKILGIDIDDKSAKYLSSRARLTPRIANRLLRRVRDYADVNGDGIIDYSVSENAMNMLEIDDLGLDPSDRRVLLAIMDNYSGGPVGIKTLSALTGDEQSTIEDFFEPYLIQIGLIERTPKGRKATYKAYKHLDKKPKKSYNQKNLL